MLTVTSGHGNIWPIVTFALKGVRFLPSETFYKLSEEKRNNILNAIKKEFSRVSLEDVSVNRIVEDSKIAKGSFYQYFKDKNEAIIYILKEFIHLKKQEIKGVINSNNGDIFKSTIIVFDDMLSNKQNEEDIKFIENAVHGIASKGINLMDIKDETCIDSCDNSILECIDLTKYNIKEMAEIKAMLELIVRSLGAAVIGVLNNKEEYESIKKELVMQLKIIKNGVIKEECKC